MISLLGSFSALSFAQQPLLLSIDSGRLIHDASYLPRPSYWPPEWPWDGSGLNDDTSYRYGPAMIRYSNNKLHFWSCSEGDANVADYIRYKHSSNGGRTWGEEVIALAPTIGSEDGWAICDPSVVKVGSYYFMAYTATDNSFGAGLNNHIFIARSLYPDREFQKWNGTGWGGAPKPIIRYSGAHNKWGLGEPNLVVKGNTVYVYYTEDQGTAKTRVATAQLGSANWPANLTAHGYAISSRDIGEDQTDIKYLPAINRFIATAIGNRFMHGSYIHAWQSSDGLRFTPLPNDIININMQPYAHNLGMSGNYLGHAEMGAKEFIAYSYTAPEGSWGRWNTWLHRATITGAGWDGAWLERKPDMAPILLLLLDD